MLAALSFDLLVTADAKGNPVPDLAAEVPTLENGGISDGGRTIVYHLRRNVTWQDGAPFTSRDVKFTYDAIMNPRNNVIARTGYPLITSVTIPDAYTIAFHTAKPYAPFVNTIFAESDSPFRILPAHLLEKYRNLNEIPFNAMPVGTGPFRLVSWQRGDRLEYVANEHYFLGKPKLHRIVVRIVPDENTLVTEMRTHALDWMFEATPEAYKILKTIPDVRTVLPNSNQYWGMIFNTARPPLDDVRVRRAIAYAIDKGALVREYTAGSATVATEDLPSFMWAYSPDVTIYRLDLAKARSLLAAAGWQPGPDGRLRKSGLPMALTLTYVQGQATAKVVSVQIQETLGKLGIELRIKPVLGAQLFAAYPDGGVLQHGGFDLNLSGWIAGVDPDDSSQFRCAFRPPAGENYSRYCTPAMEAAQEQATTNVGRAVRKAAYAKIQRLLADDMPQDFFWWPRNPQAINPDFHGFSPNPATESWNAYEWDI